MALCLITDTKYILQEPGFRPESYQETGSSAKLSSFPPEWKKEKCHPDRWMTDEWFPFMRLRMLTLICCHVSPWLKCVCVYELAWERRKSEKERKERASVWWWDFSRVILLAITFSIQGSPCRPHLSGRRHRPFTWSYNSTGVSPENSAAVRERKCVERSWIKTNPSEMYNISRHIQLQGLLHNLTFTSLPTQIIYPLCMPTEYSHGVAKQTGESLIPSRM